MRSDRRLLFGLAAVAVAAAVTGACGTSGSTGGSAPPAAPPAAATSAPSTPGSASPPATGSSGGPTSSTSSPAAVPAVLDFRSTTVDGGSFAGVELAGHKTVLWFWAPWCTVCAREAGAVKQAAAALGPDVRVVGVAGLSSDAADMRRFVERGGLQSMTSLADTGGDLFARFGVNQQDTFVLIRPDGTVSRHPSYSQDVDIVALARQTFG